MLLLGMVAMVLGVTVMESLTHQHPAILVATVILSKYKPHMFPLFSSFTGFIPIQNMSQRSL